MKRKALFSFLLGVGLAAMAAPVVAADAGISENPFNGFYTGVHAGYGWGDSSIDYEGGYTLSSSAPGNCLGSCYDQDSDDFAGSQSLSPQGWLLGAQAGANFVTGSGLLLGAEISGSWLAMSDDVEFEDGDAYVSGEQSINALGLAQVKLGWANDTMAIYGMGGLAMASVETSVNVGAYGFGPSGPLLVDFGDTQTVSGWTLGAGGDVMVADNVSVGMTYNFVRLEVDASYLVEEDSGGIISTNLAAEIDMDSTIDAHIVKATLNYHF